MTVAAGFKVVVAVVEQGFAEPGREAQGVDALLNVEKQDVGVAGAEDVDFDGMVGVVDFGLVVRTASLN